MKFSLIQSSNMVLVSFWALNYTLFLAATAHPLDINKLHTMFGHPNSQVLAATVSNYGSKTKNKLEHTCPNCAICKAKQKNLNKLNSN
jgi:hypothetical protein